MYAIVDISGTQRMLEKGIQFAVNRLPKKEGALFKLQGILFAKKGNAYLIGRPYIKDAHVECEVVSHVRGPKVIAYKYRRRKSYHRKVGYRQDLTVLRVKEIHI